MNKLIRDLELPEDGVGHLASASKEKGSSAKGTKSRVYRNGKQNFRKYFHFKGVSTSVAHKKGGFLGFFLNMKTARKTNDLLRILEYIFIQQ